MTMTKQTHYSTAEHISPESAADPYLRPAFSSGNRLRRLAWTICWAVFYRMSPRPFHFWRSFLLRAFGAIMGPGCHFYPASKVWAPWNLICADQVTAANGAEIYNPAPVTFGSHAILSQDAYVCGATHDYDDATFPLIAYEMGFGAYAWICARASVAPGVQVGEGAVLGLGSVATRDLEPWTVNAGVPARKVKDRKRWQLETQAKDDPPTGSRH
jgi:putative colanic acid biosynthesis acetyltransferase WcaF